MAEGIAILAILAVAFTVGLCSMDQTWENACRKDKPVIVDNEVYKCRKQ